MDDEILFSVIIPIYNRKKYLPDAIESVLHQSFEMRRVEVILIDDGSTDGSGEICDQYGKKYPDVIRVIHQHNQGASAARNRGVAEAAGRWLNFLDSDDKLAKNAFREAKKFIKKYDDQTDVIAFPVWFFGTRHGEHILNYKFNSGSRVVDLEVEWNNPQLFINSSFIRATTAKKVGFNDAVDIPTNEDAREMQRILLEKKKIGFLATTKYWYRRHNDTLVNRAKSNHKWYIDSLQQFSLYIMKYAEKKCGYIPKFIQNVVMYEFQWRFRQNKLAQTVLSEDELQEYKNLLLEVCDMVDTDVIMAQKQLWREHKAYLIYRKERNYSYLSVSENNIENTPLRLSFATFKKDRILLEGWIPHFLFERRSVAPLSVAVNDKIIPLSLKKIVTQPQFFGHYLYDKYSFSVDIDLNGERRVQICFLLKTEDKFVKIKKIFLEQFFPLDSHCRYSYKRYPGWIMQKRDADIILKRCRCCLHYELSYLTGIILRGQRGSKRVAVVRLLYGILNQLPHKEIWMISDRILKADDNGEALFTYLCKIKPKGLKIYFVISKESPDYRRLKKIGPVVGTFSVKHRLLHLLSTYNISSQGEKIVQHPFRGYELGYRSLRLPKFVFLQHGVTKDDLSAWLNRYNKNLFGFVTTSIREYRSILEGDYFYTEKEVWLTGFSRYDYLKDDHKKIISIVPTWRSYLLEGLNKENGTHLLRNGFINSEYYLFYNALINHERLLEELRKNGYKLRFVPHPLMQPYIGFFHKRDDVEFASPSDSYRVLFAESSLLITDYSSTVFDFAYLNKPVLYCQFDRDDFFSGKHTYNKGYFDYEKDGFGEVEYNLEDTVERIIEYANNGCQLKEKYKKRIEEVFAYHDQNNCERIYQKLINMREEIQL